MANTSDMWSVGIFGWWGCDYPAESDVTEGTKFSNDTLTGTFVRNVVGGAIVEGQDTVGTVVGSATAGVVIGE